MLNITKIPIEFQVFKDENQVVLKDRQLSWYFKEDLQYCLEFSLKGCIIAMICRQKIVCIKNDPQLTISKIKNNEKIQENAMLCSHKLKFV